jgi:hypothetical protein
MNKKSLAILSAGAIVISSFSLSACGNKVPKERPVSAPTATEAAVEVATIGFDAPLDLGNGITITVSKPVQFTPTIFASNYVKGQLANSFGISVKNDGTEPLDLSLLSLIVTAGTSFTAEVLDGDSGITGAPLEPLAAGATTSFKYGITSAAKKGTALNLKITLGTNVISVDGTLV